MTKFGKKGNVSDEDFMIHILNNLPEEYDVILDRLENCLMVTGENALMINSIREKLNHWYDVYHRRQHIRSRRIPGLVIPVCHATSPMTKLVCMMSSTLTNQFRVAPALCLLQKRASYASQFVK